MKVESVEAFPVSIKANERLRGGSFEYSHYQTVLVKAVCDGVEGWGEAMTRSEPEATALLARFNARQILGAEVDGPTRAWETIWKGLRVRGHTRGADVEALSGIEMALYDCFGKIARKPISKILNPKAATKVPVYAGAVFASRGSIADQVEVAKSAGMMGAKVKVGFGVEPDRRTLEGVRKEWPEGMLVADANGAYDGATALKACSRFKELGLAWFEEPVLADDLEGYARLRGRGVPIGAGEAWYGSEITDAVEKKIVDVIEPSVSRCGGINVEGKVARAAVASKVGFSPMVGMNSVLSLVASMQVAAGFGSLGVEASPFPNPLQTEVADFDLSARNGSALLPGGPGLGVEVDEAYVRRNSG